MKLILVLEINLDNAAFSESTPEDEVKRIIRENLYKLDFSNPSFISLYDFNGNKVGVAETIMME
jgi:signal transduction histidine kinase